MKLERLKNLSTKEINEIRAEIKTGADFQVAQINLLNDRDPSAILTKDKEGLLIASDKHSYSKKDRIFPINQDENTVFAQYVYRDSKKHKYDKVLDLATGSGVIAMASAKAGAPEVIGLDINPRSEKYIKLNNELNGLKVQFVKSDLFQNIEGSFDKITINPPFMPAPAAVFPLHAQGGTLGLDISEKFFKQCWKYLNPKGTIQGIFHSFGNDSSDTVLDLIKKYLPTGWSYSIQHVFPIKNIPIELYANGFQGQKGYDQWLKRLHQRGLIYSRFFMITIWPGPKPGLIEETVSKPRLYNLIYPPTTLAYLAKAKLATSLLKKPISETEFPTIGQLFRLARYNYQIYLVLKNLLIDRLAS